jgi:hypothetical protein
MVLALSHFMRSSSVIPGAMLRLTMAVMVPAGGLLERRAIAGHTRHPTVARLPPPLVPASLIVDLCQGSQPVF